METPHTETVVEKTVAFVKDVLGIHPDPAPEVEARREYSNTIPAVTAEDAMRLSPNAHIMRSVGQIGDESYVRPVEETDTDRPRREVAEDLPQKTALELNAESAQAEDNG